jgi:hypothetical protein
MKKQNYIRNIVIFIFFISMIYAKKSASQIQSMAGPRIGVTFLGAGGTADYLLDKTDGPSAFTTQYGWQWESRFASGSNITGLVEWVVVMGGMEHGRFLPSINSIVGFRNSEGIEMGMGPSVSLGGIGMVFAFGKTVKSGELNIPINLVFSPPKDNSGLAISVLIGFNMRKE